MFVSLSQFTLTVKVNENYAVHLAHNRAMFNYKLFLLLLTFSSSSYSWVSDLVNIDIDGAIERFVNAVTMSFIKIGIL